MEVKFELHHGDCLDWMPTVPDGSIDAIISDPPYPEIDRDYGRMTESAWMDMMQEVVRQARRILKTTGSAVFILQPNSEKVGKMRLWLWEFMVWAGKEWNIVQDAYWWNIAAQPTVHTQRVHGLMRNSVKMSVWIGNDRCYRNQDAVVWAESTHNLAQRLSGRCDNTKSPSGHSANRSRMLQSAEIRGGVTPFNLLPLANTGSRTSAGANCHGAGTPLKLADWWTRYICPPGGTVCDPFAGSGTMGIAALNNGCNFIGYEKMSVHYETACYRLNHLANENSAEPVRIEGKETDTLDLPLFA